MSKHLDTLHSLPPAASLPKVVFITGSAQRIGAAMIRAFHQAGYRVIIHCHRSLTAAQSLANYCNVQRKNSAKIVQGDLENSTQLKILAEQAIVCFGSIDVLIHNASRFYPTPIEAISLQDWDNLMHSNAKAPLFLSHYLQATLAQNQGSIISLLDIHANGRPFLGYTLYNMAKAAHQMLVQSLALEFAPHIRVNGIAPGVNLLPEPTSEQAIDVQKVANICQSIPLQRMGTPDDIAQAALFLASANYITGHILAVDGGRSLTLKGG